MDSQAPDPQREGDPAKPRGGKFKAGNWLSLGQMATSGVELGLTVAVLTLLGWWLDKQWNTSPWLLLTGAFIGATGSIYKMYLTNKRWFGDKK